MAKMLTACAAIAVTAVVALFGTAKAAERQSIGVRNVDRIDNSTVVCQHQQRSQRQWSPAYDRAYAYEQAYGAMPMPIQMR
jgi:hypothetical protein